MSNLFLLLKIISLLSDHLKKKGSPWASPSSAFSLQSGLQSVTRCSVSSTREPHSLHPGVMLGSHLFWCFLRKLCPVVSCTMVLTVLRCLLSKILLSLWLTCGYHIFVCRQAVLGSCHLFFATRQYYFSIAS